MQTSWMETYGLWAVLLGGIVEGETVFVAAGYAASQGYLSFAPSLALGFAGATLGDHFFFWTGRTWGAWLLRRAGGMRPLRARAVLLIRRWGRATAFASRFAYGLRSVVPLVMGSARFPALTFSMFNLLGSAAFATLYLSLGYFFGEAMEELLGRTRGEEWKILVGIVTAGALVWIIREWRIFHPRESLEEPDEDPDAPR
jgi:membrane protein DedA with SNARE-associated domain